ncbi:hypothetical protein [Cesiribacter andamanensis]|uniref:Uncharacterized protein n=1 Tax=Cesiribacter andamanensis AMV16 TaxID=1279009 RepID=M7N389_9BACT|nr:hypothetical protein [Cesiribacter andamanensis]EMR01742.1 hypothetical protein ADICEAN_03138 [Cesiribacter andamanensis AMV16]
MFKKFTMVALMLVGGASATFAQNIKDEWVKIPYLQLPRQVFGEEVKTYTSRILIPNGLAADQDRNSITASLQTAAAIPGYEQSEDGAGIITEISLGWYSIPNYPEVITTTKKEKRGDKEVDVEYYSYRMQFRYPMQIRVLQGEQVIESTYINNSNDFSYASTDLFPTKAALYKFWEESGNKFKSGVRDKHLSANRDAIKAHLIHQYGYVKTHMREEIKFVKEKKDATDYAKLTSAFELVNAASPKKLEGDVYPSETYVADINAAMALWKEELAVSEPDNRKARIDKKVTEAILKNLVIGCYLSYQFAQADEYLTRLEELKEGIFVRAMRDKMADVQYRLAQYEKIYARN